MTPPAPAAREKFSIISEMGWGVSSIFLKKFCQAFLLQKKITLNEKKISTFRSVSTRLKFMQDKSYLTAGESTPSESFEIDAFKVALREVLDAAGHKIGTRAALACEHSFVKGALTVRPELIDGCPILAVSIMSSRSIL